MSIPQSTKRRIEALMARAIPATNRHRRVVVLCYHSVHPSLSFASVSPTLFGEHVAWLNEACDVVPLSLIPHMAGRTDLNRPVVALTFDDGYADNHTHAFPVLAERSLPATFFITTGLIERDPEVLDYVSRLWGASDTDLIPLSWPQLAEMNEAGMSVGAHSCTHRNLARVNRGAALVEIVRSKEVLEDHIGIPIHSFAYPFGKPSQHYTGETAALVKEAGFRLAVAVLYRGVRVSDDAFRIPRLAITGDSVEMLQAKVAGKLDLIGVWQERAPLWAGRAISTDFTMPQG